MNGLSSLFLLFWLINPLRSDVQPMLGDFVVHFMSAALLVKGCKDNPPFYEAVHTSSLKRTDA